MGTHDERSHGDRIVVRRLSASEVGIVGTIDRSEHLDTAYAVVDGELVASRVAVDVPGWDPDGEGEHSVAEVIRFCRGVLDRGGVLLGAERDGDPAGVAVVLAGPGAPGGATRAWLAFLHVTRAARRSGVGSALWTGAEAVAREAGATDMYVSAAPTGSAVGFYLGRGGRLAGDETDPELLRLEPEDVHLICPVGR